MADMCSRSGSSEPPKKKTKGNNFRWDESMHGDLIDCLREYKIRCEYNGIDFDADKVAQYRAVRLAMAKKYEHDISLFGPVSVTPPPRQMQELKQQEKVVYEVQSKQENNLISRGHNPILEKVKSLRQGFSKAVLAGRRSGCGKLVYDHYDSLKGIWGGSPNTEPLPSGVDTDEVNQVHHLEDETDENHATESSNEASSSDSVVPKLIDDKRKHLQRKLSASQRNDLLIGEAKEEKLFRTEMAAALKNSSESFAGALNNISQSMEPISSSLNRSLEVLAQTLGTPQATHPTPLLPAYHPRDTSLCYPAMNLETFNYQQS